MKKIFKYKFLIAGLLIILGSCQKMEYSEQLNWAYPVSGEWTITVEYQGSKGVVKDGSYIMKTYNTSFGKDSIWFDDKGSWFPIKAKLAVNMATKTFSTTNYTSTAVATWDKKSYTTPYTINNGKVVNNDSIYMEIVDIDGFVENVPGKVYKVYGHRRVSYEEYNNL